MASALSERCLALREWFGTRLGANLLATERSLLDELLPQLFGYHLLQLSVTTEELHTASPVGHKVRMGLEVGDGAPFAGDLRELPFPNDTLDVVLVHHLLENCETPTQILREASRVTIPSGYLVVVGFNPFSAWGAWKLIRFWDGRVPFCGEYLRAGRLMDWLTLLEFRIDRALYAYYRLPSERLGLGTIPDFSQGLSRRMNWPFGAVYIIVARKQVAGMTPLRPRWRERESPLAKLPVVKPAGGHTAGGHTAGRGSVSSRAGGSPVG